MIRCRKCGSRSFILSGTVYQDFCVNDIIYVKDGDAEMDFDDVDPGDVYSKVVYDEIRCEKCDSTDIEGIEQLKELIRKQVERVEFKC